jgi:hypothetical protein
MRASTFAFAVVAGVASLAYAAESGHSKDYKVAIQDYVALNVGFKHPEYGKLYFGFSEPGRVLFGDKKQQRLAVRCNWSADLKNGEHLLMMVRETFLIDEGFVYKVSSKDRIEWVDGEPNIDKDQPNQSSVPSLSLVTPPAGQEARPR